MRAGSPRPGHRASILGIPGRSRSRPHLSLWEGSETAPRSGAEDRSSPLRVRFAPWTAPGRSEGMTVYEGKGGGRAEGLRRASRDTSPRRASTAWSGSCAGRFF